MDKTDKAGLAKQDQEVLGGSIRELRRTAGMTQEQLGDALGADAVFVSRIERGQRGIRWHTLMRLLRALDDVRMSEFAAEVERQQAIIDRERSGKQ